MAFWPKTEQEYGESVGSWYALLSQCKNGNRWNNVVGDFICLRDAIIIKGSCPEHSLTSTYVTFFLWGITHQKFTEPNTQWKERKKKISKVSWLHLAIASTYTWQIFCITLCNIHKYNTKST